MNEEPSVSAEELPLPESDTPPAAADPAPAPPEASPSADGAAPEDAEALRRELDLARERVTRLERERVLLSRGVPEDDLDYYLFKIGRLVTPEKDFSAAAKDFLQQHRPRQAAGPTLSTGASLASAAPRPQTPNEAMNRLIRGR